MEELVYRDVRRKNAGLIYDIGGHPGRHKQLLRQDVWSCSPIITTSDYQRAQYLPPDNHCKHTFSECVCEQKSAAGWFISIDSLYYLTFEEICYAAQRGLTASIHDFRYMYRKIPQKSVEATYMVDMRGQVNMNVNGANNGYNHSACLWVFQTTGINFPCGTLCWKIKDTYAYSAIVEFVWCNTQLEIYPVLSSNFQSTSQIRANEIDDFYDLAYYSVPDVKQFDLWVYKLEYVKGRQSLLLPRSIVENISSKVVFTERSDILLSTVTARVDEALKRSTYPSSLAYHMMPWIVYVVMTHNVTREEQINFLRTTRKAWRIFTRTGNLFYFAVLTFLSVLAFGAMLVVVATSSISKWFYIVVTLVFVTAVFSIFSCISCLFRSKMSDEDKQPLLISHINYYHPKSGGQIRAQHVALTDPKLALRSYESNYPIGPMLSESLFVPTTNITVKPKQKGPQPVGICNVNSIPTAPASSTNNEDISVATRFMPSLSEYMESANNGTNQTWKLLFEDKEKIFDLLFNHKHPNMPDKLYADFDKWNNRPAFTRIKRQRHEEAHAENARTNIIPEHCYLVSSFVKRELHTKGDVMEGLEYKPRAIMVVHDRVKVAISPWIYAYSKWLGRVWDGSENSYVFYPIGKSTEVVGRWFDQAHKDLNGRIRYIETDGSTFDATVSKMALEFQMKLFKMKNMPSDIEAAWRRLSLRPSGYTRSGSKFERPGGRLSGSPDTSCGNSLVNATAQVAAIHNQFPMFNYIDFFQHVRIIVLGDDSLIITDLDVDVQRMEAYITRLGFKPKVLTPTRYKVSFCSALFWPSDVGTTLGLDPRRFFKRTGWTLKNVQGDLKVRVRADALGLNKTCSHIPMVGDVVRKLLQVTKSENKKLTKNYSKYYDPYKWYGEEEHSPVPATYVMMQDLTGINQELLKDFQHELDKITEIPILISHPAIDLLC